MRKFDIEVEGNHNYFVDGVMVHNSPETTTGGRALKFYSSVRLDVRRIETLKDGTDMVGNRTRVKVVKNKVAPPFKQAEFDIMYGQGISREGGLIDVGVEAGLVRKAGAWYTYEGDQLGQGKENARTSCATTPTWPTSSRRRSSRSSGSAPLSTRRWWRPRRAHRDRLLTRWPVPCSRRSPPTGRTPTRSRSRARSCSTGSPVLRAAARTSRRRSPEERPRRHRTPAARPLHRGRAGRRRGVRPRLGGVTPAEQGAGSPGLGARAAPQGRRVRGRDERLDELDADAEAAVARELVRRRLRSVRNVPEPARSRRLLGMLARKGYPAGMALDAIREELGADEEWQRSIGERSQTSS
jgi:hypothetical protein